MKKNSKSIDNPSLIEIRDFFISVDNDVNRNGAIYANGAMQAVVYIHYYYQGEEQPNTEAEAYIREHITFYNKGESPDAESPGSPKPFNVEETENDLIHDLEKDTGKAYPAATKATEFSTQIFLTVAPEDAATYTNFQPYVDEATHTFSTDTVMVLDAESFKVSAGSVSVIPEEQKDHDNGISDLWAVQYSASMPTRLKLRSLIDFRRNDYYSASGNTLFTSTGTYLKDEAGEINCMLIYLDHDSPYNSILGYTPEYYGISGSPAPYFGIPDAQDILIYDPMSDSEDYVASLLTGTYTHDYPANDYGDRIQDRFDMGKIYLFIVSEENGSDALHITDTDDLNIYSFNELEEKCYFLFNDNAGNQVNVQFDIDGTTESQRYPLSILDVTL